MLLCVTVVPRAAAAQSSRVDAAGGYAWLHDHDGDVTFSRGWFASIGADVIGPLGIVGDVSSSSKSLSGLDVELSMRITSIAGGPRVTMHTRHVTPFAQILFGTTRFTTTYRLVSQTLSDSSSLFSTQFDGGVDVHLMTHVSARLGARCRVLHSETYTPTGSRPFTFRESLWFAGLALR